MRSACFALYDTANVHLTCYDVVVNRPKQAAYRAPGAPMASFAVESVLDEIALELDMDPIELRLRNAVKEGSKSNLRSELRAGGHGGDARGGA